MEFPCEGACNLELPAQEGLVETQKRLIYSLHILSKYPCSKGSRMNIVLQLLSNFATLHARTNGFITVSSFCPGRVVTDTSVNGSCVTELTDHISIPLKGRMHSF